LSGSGLLLVGLAMVAGLAGTVVPLLPGLPVIWLAGLVWAASTGGPGAWLVLALLTALAVAGTVAHYAVPARSVGAAGAPRSTLLLGGVGAFVGTFVIPLVGFVVGGVLGVYLAEWARTRDPRTAWSSTRQVLKAFGLAMAIEVGAALLMILTWLVGVALT
jgi:uncharacterized protein YqgC (DUF456 family)